MSPGVATGLLWAGVILSAVVALAALNGVLMAAMLLVGHNAEVNFAIWAIVFAVAIVALVACAVRLWKRHRYFS
jgi:hypothetical protein